VKYILLIYANPLTRGEAPKEELDAIFGEVDALMSELNESGEWVGGEGLADPSTARTVRLVDGAAAVTDGPFPEAKEHLAGYCMIETETDERALEIAARWPDARYNGVELRAVMTPDGTEM
jgi:hypothetical protein